MAISKKEVEHIAHLARLDLKKGELIRFQKELGEVLAYVDKLKKLKLEAIPDDHELKNVFRNDQEEKKESQNLLLDDNLINGRLRVPLVFDDET